MADKPITEKVFKDTEAVEIIKSALLSGVITLSGPNHPQYRIPQKNADSDASYLKALYGALTSSGFSQK